MIKPDAMSMPVERPNTLFKGIFDRSVDASVPIMIVRSF